MAKKNEVQLAEEKYNDLAAFVQSLNTEHVAVENCKLCNSKRRKEAEDRYEKGESVRSITRWLEEHGEEISYGAVNNHLTAHFKTRQENLDLRELATRLSKWSGLVRTDEALMNRYIQLLDMEAMSLLAQNKNLPLLEVRKNNELVLKIAAVIAQYKDQLHKIHAEKRPVEVVITSLNRIIQFKLEGASPEVRKVLNDIIDQMDREIGEISIDGSKELENG